MILYDTNKDFYGVRVIFGYIKFSSFLKFSQKTERVCVYYLLTYLVIKKLVFFPFRIRAHLRLKEQSKDYSVRGKILVVLLL